MTEKHTTRAIVLKKEDRGENNKLIFFFSEEYGRLNVFGRSIRKIESKLRSLTEEYNLSEIQFVVGKRKTLTDVKVLKSFSNIKKDLIKLDCCKKISDVLDLFLREEHKDITLWKMISEYFEAIDELEDDSKISFIFYHFLWSFLSELGYMPCLFECVVCGKTLSGDQSHFSLKDGGVVCSSCSPGVKNLRKLEKETVKSLETIFGNSLNNCLKLKINIEDVESLKKISNDYFLYILESTK
jgi:DNA repair protein RecO (recombination protein O)